jgi:hypothetical protein
MSKMQYVFRAAFVVLLGLATYASIGAPPSDDSSGFVLAQMVAAFVFGDPEQADKVGHFITYAALGGAARFASFFPNRFWAAPSLLALYGALMEGVQYFLPARSADVIDGLANTSGAFVGFAAASMLFALAAARRQT